jgi:hypothetical protein
MGMLWIFMAAGGLVENDAWSRIALESCQEFGRKWRRAKLMKMIKRSQKMDFSGDI